jgi:hypothetical protein
MGAALLGVALGGQSWWQWQGVWPGIVVNVGTAFLLAAVLFLFERRFTRRVVRAGTQAIQQAAEQVEERLQRHTDQLTARIDELQQQVDQRMRDRAQEADRKIAALSDDISYATVTDALTEANQLRAIPWGQVTVQASSDPDGLALVFKWGEASDGQYQWHGIGPELELQARIEADFGLPGGRPHIATEWRPTDTPADVAERLIRQLQAAGRWQGPDTLDWALALRNLRRSLALTVASRRDGTAAGPWQLRGALYELVGEDWAITEAGIENRLKTRSSCRTKNSRPQTGDPGESPWTNGHPSDLSGPIKTSGSASCVEVGACSPATLAPCGPGRPGGPGQARSLRGMTLVDGDRTVLSPSATSTAPTKDSISR